MFYLSTPDHITVGPDGALWFNVYPRPNIDRMTTYGQVREFPTASTATVDVAIGLDGEIWFATVTDLARMAADGTVTYLDLPPGSIPRGMKRNVDGALWYMDFAHGDTNVSRRSPSGETTTSFLTESAVGHSTALGANGDFWISADRNFLFRVKPSGETTKFTLPDPRTDPSDLAVGPDGSLWYASGTAKLAGRVTAAGQIQEYPLPEAPTSAVARGADGNIWFGTGSGLYRFDSGGFATFFPWNSPTPIYPRHMVAGPDGDLWFSYSGLGLDVGIARFQLPVELSPVQYLGGARFEARVTWSSPGYGSDVPAPTFRMTGDTGAFSFFSPGNLELVVKVVDGTAFNGRRWVFVAGLTDVAYTLTIRDILTGTVRTYSRPAGQMSSFADTSAFGP